MAVSILIIAVLTYALCLPDVCSLVSRYAFQDDLRQYGASDYPHMLQRFRWLGLGYALIVDVIRALVAVLIGGILLKGAGFPSVGKLLVLFFTLFYALMSQTFPAVSLIRPKKDMVYPALLLLFVDWRLFLVCVILAVAGMALTGSHGVMALAAAVGLPLFTLIFRGTGLKVFLALLCGVFFVCSYLDDIRDFFSRRKQKAARRAQHGVDPRTVESREPEDPNS